MRLPNQLEEGWQQLTARLEAEQGWFRAPYQWSSRMRVLVVLAVAVLALGLVFKFVQRVDLLIYPSIRMALVLLSLVILFVGAVLLVLRPQQRMALHHRLWITTGVAGLALPLVFALLPAAHLSHPASLAGQHHDLWSKALACLLFGALVSLPTLGLLVLVERHRPPRLKALVLTAVVAGLMGNLALQLHCPITHSSHLLLGHAPLGLLLVASVLVIGLFLQKKRTRS